MRKRLERFQLLCSAGFPACGLRRLSGRLFRGDQTRDKNVPQTRRQECLRYMKDGTALIEWIRLQFPGKTLAMASRRSASKNGLLIMKSTPVSGLPEDFNISA